VFKPFGKGNPCKVCGQEDSACRQHTTDDNYVHCHTHADARKFEVINGWKCIEVAKGHTAGFRPDDTGKKSQEYITRQLQENALRKKNNQAKEKKLREQALPVVERHKHYSEILDQLTTDKATHTDLLRRGFSEEEITRSGFKSVKKSQRLNKEFPANLPGVRGSQLAVSGNGFLCPIRDFDGNITGMQLRLHTPVDGNRYRWLSTPEAATLKLQPENENPLAVFHPPSGNPEGIAIVEGTGAKPFLVAQRLNYLTIGGAGGQFPSSPQLLKKNVELAHEVLGGEKVITIFPDAGDVSNPGVINRWKRTTNQLLELGWDVRFGWWGQVNKSLGDIDELSPEQYSTIRYLSVAEFKAFCIKYGGLEKPKTNNAVPFSYEERVAQAQKYLTTLETPTEIICDPTQKYLPNLVGRIPTSGLVGLKAPKGSGKSFQIKQIKNHCCGYWEEKTVIPEAPELPPEQLEMFGNSVNKQQEKPEVIPQIERIHHKGLGMKFLSINARIALGREQAIKWEFTWIEDADLDGKEEFGGEKLATTSIIENLDEIGLCWDSLGKVFGRDWSNTMVVIDELELGLNHLVTSSTCRDRRSFILLTIEKKLKECLDNDGLVVVADADLTDCSLDYLTAITPGHTPFIVSHDFKGDPWEVDFYTGKRDELLTQIDEWLSNENCEPIAVTLDNQLEAESLSNYLIKKYPYLKNEVGGLIRIDSKVTQTDFGKDFVKRPNQNIEKYKPKALFYTPSLGVGCSIDIHHFERVFGLFYGNLEPSQCRQSLARVREAVPRTVWAKARGMTPENEPTSYLPEAIKQRLFSFGDTSHKLIDLAVDMAKAEVGADATDKELFPKLIEVLQGMTTPDGSWNNPHVDLYCNQIARRNFAMNQLAVQLREELKEEGHRVNDCETEGSTNAGDAVKDGKEEIKLREAHKTATAPDVTIEDAQRIRRKVTRSDEEEHSATKAFLKRELPGVELTTDFVHRAVYKDKRKSLNQVKLHWWVLNADAVAYEDKKEWQSKLKQFSDGVPFLPDVRTYSPKVKAIHECGVFDWIKPDDFETEYSNGSEDAQKFLNQSLKVKKLVKNALGITVTKDSEPVALANRILSRLGLGMVSAGQVREGNQRVRYYRFDPRPIQDEFRSSVFSAQKNRWEKICAEMPESTNQQDTPLSQNSHNLLINNPSSVTAEKPISNVQNCCSTPGIVVQGKDIYYLPEHWANPETIVGVVAMLEDCVEPGQLAEVRETTPANVLKLAARQLSPEKREQIDNWVKTANQKAKEANQKTQKAS